MQLGIGKPRLQPRPFRLCLLYAVFPEDAVAGFERRQNALRVVAFAHRHEVDERRGLKRGFTRRLDAEKHRLEVLGDVVGYVRA